METYKDKALAYKMYADKAQQTLDRIQADDDEWTYKIETFKSNLGEASIIAVFDEENIFLGYL